MRAIIIAIVLMALFAGCLDNSSKGSKDITDPNSNDPIAGNRSSEFFGFRVDSISTGVNGPEPNIGVTPSGAVFATALETVMRSTDAGLTWAPVYKQVVGTTSDPMLWVDPLTGRILSPQMFPILLCSSFIKSDDDGASWLEIPAASCGSPVVDHQKVASGPYPANIPLGANPIYPNLVSYCYNKVAGTFCAMSFDGGIKYAYESIVDINNVGPQVETQFSACGGLNGHQHHAADGAIYIGYGFNCGQAVIAVSTDAGRSWQVRKLGIANVALDPEVTSTPDGTVYMFYKAEDGKAYLIRSKDRFVTFDGPFLVSPEGVETTAFMGMTAGSDGRVAMGYLGTSEDPVGGLEDDVGENATWHAYVTMTLDAGAENPTFVTVMANPADDPVQRGSICQNRGCVGGNRNLLDFVDLHAGPDGRFYFAYTDGCTSENCTSPSGKDTDSRSRILTVARLSVGPSLYADKPNFSS